MTYYDYNGLPDEFTTIQEQIEMYILNLTRAERNLRRKYWERNVSNKVSLFGMKLIPRRKEIHFRRKWSNNTKHLQTALRLAIYIYRIILKSNLVL